MEVVRGKMNLQMLEKIEAWRKIKQTTKKGELFERFALAYLNKSPVYQFSKIWRWRDWPKREGLSDTGIDAVAEERDTGKLWAIQIKFHEEPLRAEDIATFLALSGRKEFSYRLIVTSSSLGPKADELVRKQEKRVSVLTLASMLESNIDWNSFNWEKPEELSFDKKDPLPHQREAIDAVIGGFSRIDRGKLIMPPGAGKTFTALKIAERLVGTGGRVLFMAPSIALVEQTIMAWMEDSRIPLRMFAVTSDYTVGRTDDDQLGDTSVLSYPPTTNADDLIKEVLSVDNSKMTVVVSTYHSSQVIADAQQNGLPEFDLIIADEAHRTTGVVKEQDSDDMSYYHMVHDNNLIKGKKRLYMTATPRVFIPRVKKKLDEDGYDYYSMDDKEVYGEEFYRLGFGQAVDRGILSDYKVVILTVDEKEVHQKLLEYLNREDSPEVKEAAKMVGCWRALNGYLQNSKIEPLKRAVVFTGTISESRQFSKKFKDTVELYASEMINDVTIRTFEVVHVDGSMPASERKQKIAWLKGNFDSNVTRILSNAKVLTEGIDVPALDAVIFMRPRRSVVDIVQAVGRVMRTAKDKKYGYVIIPVLVNPEQDPEEALDKNEEFKTVWEVLGALRSIDDRLDAEVRSVWLKATKSNTTEKYFGDDDDKIIIDVQKRSNQLAWNLFGDELRRVLIGRIVDRVGDRRYFETWAKDVAEVAGRIERHIERVLQHDSELGNRARTTFDNFLQSLHEVINPMVTKDEALSMLVQHIITKPVFVALFDKYAFLQHNPVSQALDQVTEVFRDFIEKETGALDGFYRSVQTRAKGMDKETERQSFLTNLYDTFFKTAFPKTADRLGIVYTPVELVDFLIKSADAILREEFSSSLADEDVVILEPFTGTGTFLSRLMHIIPPEKLKDKYNKEIWGNEILLLPYYIALANIESTYYEITGEHKPFDGLVLTDSFQLMEDEGTADSQLFPEKYTESLRKQKQAKINVIISNPPWYSRQEMEGMNNQNLKYEKLDEKIQKTYAAHTTVTLKNALYDSYIRAIRLATDRIEDKGVIAFVTNSGFIDSNLTAGLRKYLAEEFCKVYVLNLRGNARLSGEDRRKEAGNVFGEGTRAGVALLILVKDKDHSGPATIYYHDIGDYLSREEKLAKLQEYNDISHVKWKQIKPNSAYDWINQRSDDFVSFPAITNKDKKNEVKEVIFQQYSLGVNTALDAWTYNFSYDTVSNNIKLMSNEFNKAVDEFYSGNTSYQNLDDFIQSSSYKVKWGRTLKKRLESGRKSFFSTQKIVCSLYRPYVKQWLYFDPDRFFNNEISRLPKLFPEPGVENIAITIKAPGNTKPFSALIANDIPDFHYIGDTQCFSLFTYEPANENDQLITKIEGETIITAPSGKQYIRRENITDWALNQYRQRYGEQVTKEDIFYYVYGLLHSLDYRKRYENDLKKVLPHIPFVKTSEDFWAFSQAGRDLAKLHLNYESIEPWPLVEEIKGDTNSLETYKVKKMRFGKKPDKQKDKTVILYNENITLRDVPLEAYEYVVNGKSAIEWIMDRYQVKTDKKSGITNDPNKWLEEHNNPRYIVDLIKRVTRISVETVRIMKGLPELDIETPEQG